MKQKDISVLLQKADELRALFVLGQRVIPFLEEIFIFVSEIQPLLDEINMSVQENLKKMPSASKQLSKVTEATELATTEIMDIVDGIVYKADIIKSNYYRIKDIDVKKRDNPIKLLESIYNAISQGKDLKPILPNLASAIASMKKQSNSEVDKIILETDELIQSIGMDSSSIMISLQVQDITSQQIAAVNNLLETIQAKLSTILSHFQQSEISALVVNESNYDEKIKVSNLHRQIAFDPDAVDAITLKEGRQQQVDDFMNEHINNTANDSQASQDDIDALFAVDNFSDDLITSEVSTTTIEETIAPEPEISEDPFEQFSQDDIDALFGK